MPHRAKSLLRSVQLIGAIPKTNSSSVDQPRKCSSNPLYTSLIHALICDVRFSSTLFLNKYSFEGTSYTQRTVCVCRFIVIGYYSLNLYWAKVKASWKGN